MKKNLLLALFFLIHCSGGAIQGVNLAFIQEQFEIPDTGNPTIVDLDLTDVCPKIEFDTTNTKTFQIRIEAGNPPAIQSTFEYAADEYEADGNSRILRGQNDSGSNFEFIFDGNDRYQLIVDYNCKNATDPDCVNTSFSCAGPLR